jgi:hypothetical protein
MIKGFYCHPDTLAILPRFSGLSGAFHAFFYGPFPDEDAASRGAAHAYADSAAAFGPGVCCRGCDHNSFVTPGTKTG